MPNPSLRQALRQLANPQKAGVLQGFFKTGPGEYGEGDRFLGVPVPALRKLIQQYPTLSSKELLACLYSGIHEERMLALLYLVQRFRAFPKDHKKIHQFYLKHLKQVNNWDLVDLSAPTILGAYLLQRSRAPLYQLAKSRNLWARRCAIVATLHFIRADQWEDTLKLSQQLLADPEVLIHKAMGWMLREVGKRNQMLEEQFLEQYAATMPRTALRYAIERFPKPRQHYYLGLAKVRRNAHSKPNPSRQTNR